MDVDDERLPVVVAAGQCLERTATVTAMDLSERATTLALELVPGLRSAVDTVAVVNMLSPAPAAPGAALAQRVGLVPARTEVSTIGGNSPQLLVSRAAAAVAAGQARAVLVAGAEAQRSQRSGSAGGGEDGGGGHDEVVGDNRSGVSPNEMAAGLVAPVHVYALFDSVLAARAGRTFGAHRRFLGTVMAPFTEVAAGHPTAWFAEARTAAELAEVSDDNRLVAEPYPKRMCAVLHVDQGAAVVVTSLAEARRAGVADRAVFCLAAAEVSEVWFPSERPDPGTSPAMAAAARAVFETAGVGVDDVDAFDLYSCFPCVVQMAAEALGVDTSDKRGLTVTGGLPYFGGPGNNYTLHGIATMTDRIRLHGGTGLVSGLGWYATKHAYGLYGDRPPAGGFRLADTDAAQRAIDATAVPVAAGGEGQAEVVAATVVAGRDGMPTAAPLIARLPDGRHLVAAAADGEAAQLAGRNLVGETVEVTGSPSRYRVA